MHVKRLSKFCGFRFVIVAVQALLVMAVSASAQEAAPVPAPADQPEQAPQPVEAPEPADPTLPTEPGAPKPLPPVPDQAAVPEGSPEGPAQAGAEASAPATELDAAAQVSEEAEAEALAQQLAQGGAAEAAVDEHELQLYGFIDFTYTNGLGTNLVGQDRFAVGKMNLYLASELGDNWRTLSEVRFSYLPHGTSPTGPAPAPRTDTSVPDYTNVYRPVRWGGVILERAWLEYTADPLLNVRMGHFLTPYGIWNVDHGSPVIIGVRTPYVIGDQLFPRSQTGIQLHGIQLLPPVKVGYHLTLSNGRGPIDTHQDLDGNKALGGRLYAQTETSAGELVLGFSGYRGTYTDSSDAFVITAEGFRIEQLRTTHYEEQGLAADFTWDWGGLAVQAEAIMQDIVFDDALRPLLLTFEGPPGFTPDHRKYGAYAQAGYRFDWGGVMPYAGYEYYDDNSFLRTTTEAWAGLNVRPTPRVVLKAQYTHAWFHEFEGFGDDYKILEFQAAWSF